MIKFNDNFTLSIEQTKKPKKITGTKLAAILGKNQYSTPFQVWCDITHAYEFPFEDTKYTLAGKVIEPKQAEYVKYYYDGVTAPTDIYGENYFNKTYGNFFDDDIFGGMWDYLNIIDGEVESVFEMKTTSKSKKKLWDVDIPEYYALQAALYAYLLKIDKIHMVVSFLDSDDYNLPEYYQPSIDNTYIIDFNLSQRYPNFEDDYIKPAIEWWNKYVVTGVSPQYTDNDKELIESIIEIENQSNKVQENKVDTFLNNIDINKVNDLLNDTHSNVETFESVSNNVVSQYTQSLDSVMQNLYRDVIMIDNAPTELLEKYFLELTSTLYFCGEKLEHLGVYDDMSKSAMKEVYNEAYLNNQMQSVGTKNKTTVAENQAVAEGAAIYHTAVNSIYSRSYKIFKYKIDAGYEMVKTLSKIISRRMQEMQLSSPDRNSDMIKNRQVLNENNNYWG